MAEVVGKLERIEERGKYTLVIVFYRLKCDLLALGRLTEDLKTPRRHLRA